MMNIDFSAGITFFEAPVIKITQRITNMHPIGRGTKFEKIM